jgi:hypothetical protein
MYVYAVLLGMNESQCAGVGAAGVSALRGAVAAVDRTGERYL